MRIGFFTETFLPQTNGVVTSIESFGEELVKRGHEVHVYCPKTDIQNYKGMIVHSMPSVTFVPYPEFRVALPFGKVGRLDIVHTHGPFLMGKYGLRVARKQNIPKVSTFHTLLSEFVKYIYPLKPGRNLLKSLAWSYSYSHYINYDRLITPSRVIKDMLKIARPIDVIPTGINIDILKPQDREESREKLGLTAEKIYLCLGRLSFEKNLDLVIDAAKDFLGKDSQLIIAGKGPALESLEKQVKGISMEQSIKFVGYIPEADKTRYYSAADAFITASTSETQGIVVLEAMACSCPVIGANSLAIPEFVKDGENGFLFEPGNAKQLSDIVMGFKYTSSMAKKALETAHEYSKENCTTRLEDLYKSVLGYLA